MILRDIQNLFFQELSLLYSASEIQKLFDFFSEEYLGFSGIQLRMNLENSIESEIQEKFKNAIHQLLLGQPYQQILGKAYFYGDEFVVNQNTLIPRPETEELIELILQKISRDKEISILDIGTGSGCIAISLAKRLPKAKVTALDYSEEALAVARKNADLHQVNLQFIQMDYLHHVLPKKYDIIVSNPPYIGVEEYSEIDDQVKKYEPNMALFAPKDDVLAFYRKIAQDCEPFLQDKGYVFLEINQKLGQETLELYRNILSEAHLLEDLSGNPRMIWGQK
ncbi:peptide chain release factor N(5)-glutamine methyltransferase [Elizabethkingia sp. JS20170427COW]|uniref:peptide chain release factor N(5)-glutamine methyltransferase n=1 Tax=Elizabethkingia sp. JS20170427COW TaxID=2583851 RepID=UPI001110E0BD|nr:peptide chain release factor N(5)-glutamine methyltransferase [Elizabethkingia sp. JS20170427COW]QCX52390.1 peptide chain release factor N(5)-glutamine methyltransferase [Elizabethkingia sp. JS20170427COW]